MSKRHNWPTRGDPHNEGYIGCPDVDDPNAFAARVSGDSMAPEYDEGDIVIFSGAEPPRDGDACFVLFEDGQTTFRMVYFEGTKSAQKIRLSAVNPRHANRVESVRNVQGIYRAVYRYSKVNQR